MGNVVLDDPARRFEAEWWSITEPDPKRVHIRRISGLGWAEVGGTEPPSSTCLLSYICAETFSEGKGTHLLKIIMALADKHGVALELTLGGGLYKEGKNSGPKVDDLLRWYWKHGFVWITADGYAWRREPECIT